MKWITVVLGIDEGSEKDEELVLSDLDSVEAEEEDLVLRTVAGEHTVKLLEIVRVVSF